MKVLKERMTPEELAIITGYSRQTINKWVRKENWSTSPKPGVQGGKARLIHIDEKVRQFITSAQRASDNAGTYQVSNSSLETIFMSSIKQMSAKEQQQLTALLLREGVAGLLTRLGIRDED